MIATNIKLRITTLQRFWTFKLCNLATIMTSASFYFGFPKSSFPFGIEKVYFSMKHDCEVNVVAPGNFYTFERKRNFMHILSSHNYLYQVWHLKLNQHHNKRVLMFPPCYNCIIVVLLNVLSFLFLKVYYSISITLPLPSAPCSLAIVCKEDDCRFQTNNTILTKVYF